MKKYLIIFTVCLLASSCSKDLLKEEPKVPTGTEFYTNANDLALACNRFVCTLINVAFNQVAGFATCYGGDDVGVARDGNKFHFLILILFSPIPPTTG